MDSYQYYQVVGLNFSELANPLENKMNILFDDIPRLEITLFNYPRQGFHYKSRVYSLSENQTCITDDEKYKIKLFEDTLFIGVNGAS